MNDPWVALLFLVGFPVLWLVLSLFMNVISGWRSLARSYRGGLPHVTAGATGSVKMGGVTRAATTFTVGPYGIGIAPAPWDALVSRPLAIPWQAIAAGYRYQELGRFDRFGFMVGDTEITATGQAARMLDEAWRTWGVNRAAAQEALNA